MKIKLSTFINMIGPKVEKRWTVTRSGKLESRKDSGNCDIKAD